MLNGLTELLKYFRDERHYKSDKKEEALLAINKAIQETRKYIRKTNEGSPENTDEEMEISNLWGQAAIHARHFSKNLAEKFYIKRGYWKDPDNWNYVEAKGKDITLKHIEEQVGKLLKKSPDGSF